MFLRICTKLVPFFLVISLLLPSGLLLYPQKTEAAGTTCLAQIAAAIGASKVASAILSVPTSDTITQTTTGGSFVVDCILTPLAIQLAKAMLQNITSGVVNWINSGFKSDGNPIFTQDLRSLMKDSADQIIGDFISKDLGAGFLCNSFSLRLKINLAQSYLPYRQQSACSLSRITDNVTGFAQNNNGGGWDQWLQVTTVPQNNVFGATVLAQDELSKKIFDAASIKKDYLDWGKGFRSWRVCTAVVDNGDENGLPDPSTIDADSDQCANSETRTPGGIVESQLSASLGSDMRRLEVAKDIDAIAGALTNQLMSQVITGAQGLLGAGSRSGSKPTSYQSAINPTTVDTNLSNAINTGLDYANSESSGLFTSGATTTVSDKSIFSINNSDNPTTIYELPKIDLSITNNTGLATPTKALVYQVALTSNYATSSLQVTMALKKDNSPIRFLDIFVSPQFVAGRSDSSQAARYITSKTDTDASWSGVSAAKNINFNFKFLAYRVENSPVGTYTLDTTVYDAQGRLIKTVSSSFVIQ